MNMQIPRVGSKRQLLRCRNLAQGKAQVGQQEILNTVLGNNDQQLLVLVDVKVGRTMRCGSAWLFCVEVQVFMMSGGLLETLLLQCGDVEANPGPPKRNAGPPSAGATKAQAADALQAGFSENLFMGKNYDCCDLTVALLNLDYNMQYIKEYEDKIERMEKKLTSQQHEIDNLKNLVAGLNGVDTRLTAMTAKMDAITGVYDDLHEKMHEIDKTRQNNLLFYGIKPDFLPEIPHQLELKIHEIMHFNLQISRDVPVTKISRMISGPEVRGCQPVLVNFVHWKDREEVLRKANLLKGTHIYITEDLSRKMREHRHELQKYARQIRSKSPEKKCSLRQDKLFVDNALYVFDDDRHEVVRFARPTSPPRAGSRNYSAVDLELGLRRAASVHSVDGEATNGHDHGTKFGHSPRSASSATGVKFGSVESLHAKEHANQRLEPPSLPLHGAALLEEVVEEDIDSDPNPLSTPPAATAAPAPTPASAAQINGQAKAEKRPKKPPAKTKGKQAEAAPAEAATDIANGHQQTSESAESESKGESHQAD